MKLSTHKREFQEIASAAVEAIVSLPKVSRVASQTPENAVLGLELADDQDTIKRAVKPLVVFRLFEDAIQILMAEEWGEEMPGRTTKKTKAYYRGVARPQAIDVYVEVDLVLIKFHDKEGASIRLAQSKYATDVAAALPAIHSVLARYKAREQADLIVQAMENNKKSKAKE